MDTPDFYCIFPGTWIAFKAHGNSPYHLPGTNLKFVSWQCKALSNEPKYLKSFVNDRHYTSKEVS